MLQSRSEAEPMVFGNEQQQRVTAAALALLFAIGAAAVALHRVVLDRLMLSTADFYLVSTYLQAYTRVVIIANYFDDGFVRRGLAGTVLALFRREYLTAGWYFLAFSTVWLCIPLTILFYRLLRTAKLSVAIFLCAAMVLSPQTFSAWGGDAARTDMFVIGFIAWATIAIVANRPIVAVACLLIGALAHETALIYGLPLIIAVGFHAWREGRLEQQPVLAALALLLAGVSATVAGQHLFGADPARQAAHMLSVAPRFDYPHADRNTQSAALRDIAIYMATSGMRGVRTAICWNLERNRAHFWLASAYGLVLAGLYVWLLFLGRTVARTLFVALLPMLFMSAIGNDIGRWLMFAVANMWLFTAATTIKGVQTFPASLRLGLRTAVLGVLLLLGPANAVRASGSFDTFEQWFGIKNMPAAGALDSCDPQWRRFVYGAENGSQAAALHGHATAMH